MRKNRILGVFALMAAALLIMLGVASPASALPVNSSYKYIGTAKVQSQLGINNQRDLDNFLLSDTPKEILIDTDTGNVLSVEKTAPDVQSFALTQNNFCNALMVRLIGSNKVETGFSGNGVKIGQWHNQIRFETYAIDKAYAGWTTGDGVMRTTPTLGPWSVAVFNKPALVYTVSAQRY
ncbi:MULTISPECIES: hypothetical protein [Bifidobacterium]|jgi:hypothetical protein|uniref:Uncharacterized protein n=2 Tax=Bifidobacterium TaxID=1678 RepID=A0A087DTI9_9BIFI|nr:MULTISPECIES: hypothetical protein [Bifidobacterium]KAE8128704.1 hypothetical protein DDE84_04375 [Bifidobacterium tibiigranuli]KAE8128895.1 hypothetical protein DDF78_04165 [Bifidobacterium tibiigranuli]KFI98839.1 hypothetical protein BISU_2041 [Bifidobacterium subtile]MCH3973497.1 hypothetical protein [Bifidobacterium tibiigranuli]MCH4190631.1 hypothetical protein [Bifidobacterium tibiigranuli]